MWTRAGEGVLVRRYSVAGGMWDVAMATRPRAVRPGGVCLFNTEFHALKVETRDRTLITQNVLTPR